LRCLSRQTPLRRRRETCADCGRIGGCARPFSADKEGNAIKSERVGSELVMAKTPSAGTLLIKEAGIIFRE